MKNLFDSRLKFLFFKYALLLFFLGLVGGFIVTVIYKQYIVSLLSLVAITIYLYYTGKKLAPLFLSKRILLHVRNNSSIVTSAELSSTFNYSDSTMKKLLDNLKGKSFIKEDENYNITITEAGKKQLYVWGVRENRTEP